MGPEHEVFVAFELTKLHETHYRGQVGKVLEQMTDLSEAKKLKGEVTLVIAPGTDLQMELESMAKGSGFDPTNESEVKCNILKIAQTLDNQIDMSENDLRELLKKLFPLLPSYHINTVTRMVKKGTKEGKMERISRVSGGLI